MFIKKHPSFLLATEKVDFSSIPLISVPGGRFPRAVRQVRKDIVQSFPPPRRKTVLSNASLFGRKSRSSLRLFLRGLTWTKGE